VNDHTFRALEFDSIREMLRARAGSPPGRSRVGALRPYVTRAEVREAQELTSEARTVLSVVGRQPYHDLPELDALLPATRAEGAHLEAVGLLDMATFIAVTSDIARAISQVSSAPRLAGLAGTVRDLGEVRDAIRRAILPSGEIADDASPRLAELRRASARAKAQLVSVMESYLHDKDAGRVLQERLIATRNERAVLVLRADSRGQIPGVVHGRSSSGASLFVEPFPAVEINNDLVALADDERQEVLAILRGLTARVRDRLGELERTAQVMTQLDALQAQALLARDMEASPPDISDELHLDLRRARHPLLMASLCASLGVPRRSTREVVPVSIHLSPGAPVLVISGPNTGGKTVALKTAGLLALMAQSGLHIPADEGSLLPVFESVFADIGDEQSIAADLSTFSARLGHVVEMTRQLKQPALVLLDEVGSGTEPSEGGALGVAVVEHFRGRGAMVMATTHHGVMKTYAQTTPGVVCGSFGYDPNTYAPTYRLELGTAGRSLALEMAERLGLAPEILSDARGRLDRREADLDALARRLEQERVALAADTTRVAAEHSAVEALKARQQRLLDEIDERKRSEAQTFAKLLERRGMEVLRKTDDAIRQAVARVEAARGAPLNAAARARREAREALTAAQDEVLSDPTLGLPPPKPLPVLVKGERVRVADLGVVGLVLSLSEDDAELDVGGKRVHVPLRSLVPLGTRRAAASLPHASALPAKVIPIELNLIGLTIDEALPRVEKLLDDAILSDQTHVRIVHGHGAGRLRAAVRTLIERHPQVASFRAGGPSEGGTGATIVELKD
jgi:DNA mismatch repair protein MutS2